MPRRHQQQRVAIGRRAGNLLRAQVAGGAGLVLDHERLAHAVAQLLRQQAHHDVIGAARRVRHNDLDGLGGEGLRQGKRGQGERGGGRNGSGKPAFRADHRLSPV